MKHLPVLNNTKDIEEFKFQSLADFARPIYLDNNATTQIDDDAAEAMLKMLEKNYANPSGMHEAGKIAKRSVEDARKHVADFIGCSTEEVIFTSGGTESINTVISSVLKTDSSRKCIITCSTEHGATLNKLKEIEEIPDSKYIVRYLDVDRDGRFSLDQFKTLLADGRDSNLLVSLMAANNETGTLHHNIFDAIHYAHEAGALFHVDAVQIAGKLPLKPYIDAGTDFLTISGHKFHAPKGIGALYVKSKTPFHPMILGGYQECSRRAGTENVPGIVALGAVAKKMPLATKTMTQLHDRFINGLSNRIPSYKINGGDVPGTINVGFGYVHREAIVAKLNQYELYASVGSACSMGIEPSHVLAAMKVPEEYLHGSVRFSLSKYTTAEEIDRAIKIVDQAYTDVRAYSKGIIP